MTGKHVLMLINVFQWHRGKMMAVGKKSDEKANRGENDQWMCSKTDAE